MSAVTQSLGSRMPRLPSPSATQRRVGGMDSVQRSELRCGPGQAWAGTPWQEPALVIWGSRGLARVWMAREPGPQGRHYHFVTLRWKIGPSKLCLLKSQRLPANFKWYKSQAKCRRHVNSSHGLPG